MLIERFYGLALPPFGLVADPRFFFASKTHRRATAFLEFGLQQGMGFVVLTGDVGVGKSTVLAHLLEGLSAEEVDIASLTSSNLEPTDVLKRALAAFEVPTSATDKAGLLDTFENYLADLAGGRRRALLIIDEAQNIPDATLEELRMLTNVHLEEAFPFQCFFVGQPQFRRRLERPDMKQFRQRVLASYHVETLSAEEIRAYVEHRLDVAGWQGRPALAPAIFQRAYDVTGGVPRRINTVFNRLLLLGALEERDRLDVADLDTVLDDLRGEVVGVEEPTFPPPAPIDGAGDEDVAAAIAALHTRVDELEGVVLDLVETATRLLDPPGGEEIHGGDPLAGDRKD
jgi:type II secretory pathway predicted ATPase ExeA